MPAGVGEGAHGFAEAEDDDLLVFADDEAGSGEEHGEGTEGEGGAAEDDGAG